MSGISIHGKLRVKPTPIFAPPGSTVIYFEAGQSNSDGFGSTSFSNVYNSKVQAWYKTSQTEALTLGEYQQFVFGAGGNSNSSGTAIPDPSIYFGRSFQELTNGQVDLKIIQTALGGSNFSAPNIASNWHVGGGLSNAFINHYIKPGLSTLWKTNKDIYVLPIFWLQGENDAANSTAAGVYYERCKNFFARVREAVGIPDLSVICLRLNSATPYSDVATVQAAFDRMAREDKNIHLIEPTNRYALGGDNLHYTDNSYRLISLEYLKKAREIGTRKWGGDNQVELVLPLELSAVGTASATVKTQTSEYSRIYFGIYQNGAANPGAAAIKNGTGTGFVAKGEKLCLYDRPETLTISGLTTGATYTAFAFVEDLAGNQTPIEQYQIQPVTTPLFVDGGTVTTETFNSVNNQVHTFTTAASVLKLTVSGNSVTGRYLIVGSGASGEVRPAGGQACGGGGGGETIEGEITLPPGEHLLVIGKGGLPRGSFGAGLSGETSSGFGFTALPGAGGGGNGGANIFASGGGGAGGGGTGAPAGGSGTSGRGGNGGAGFSNTTASNRGGGGGGGAGGNGGNAASAAPGAGGPGEEFWGAWWGSGGQGGRAASSFAGSARTNGVGGAGGWTNASSDAATNAIANTGSGGGGVGSGNTNTAGAGADGIVKFRFVPAATGPSGPSATGGTTQDIGGYRVHTITADTNFVVTSPGDFEWQLWGGGASAAYSSISGTVVGGSGAGELVQGSGSLAVGTYPAVIGAEVAARTGSTGAGTIGNISTFNGLTASGGNGAISPANEITPGGVIGAGGGASNTLNRAGGDASAFDGGSSFGSATASARAGGGGAGCAGSGGNAASLKGGDGGAGFTGFDGLIHGCGGPGGANSTEATLGTNQVGITGGRTSLAPALNGATGYAHGGAAGRITQVGTKGFGGVLLVRYLLPVSTGEPITVSGAVARFALAAVTGTVDAPQPSSGFSLLAAFIPDEYPHEIRLAFSGEILNTPTFTSSLGTVDEALIIGSSVVLRMGQIYLPGQTVTVSSTQIQGTDGSLTLTNQSVTNEVQ